MSSKDDGAKVVVIDASATPGGRVATSVGVATRALREGGATVTEVTTGADAGFAVEALSACRAVIIVSPVYRATYPGELKVCLDAVGAEALVDKVMGWIAVGATPHHYLGIDQGFRSLAAWFGCLVPPTNSYLDASCFTQDQQVRPSGVAEIEGLAESVMFLSSVTDEWKFEPRPLALRKGR